VVLRDASGGLGEPKLAAGPDGVTLAWRATGRGDTTTVTALPLDDRGRPLSRPVVVASDLREGIGIAVAGDGRTVVVTHAAAGLPEGRRVTRVARIGLGSRQLLAIVAPPGWRVNGPAVTVAGAPLLAVPLAGPDGTATLIEPLDRWWRRRVVSSGTDGQVLATRHGTAVLRTGGNRQAHQVVLEPLRIRRGNR
jgi:hypothetical protein